MRKPLLAAAALAVALTAALYPREHVLCDGFAPENDMKIPVGDVRAAGIDEAQFNAVLDKVQAVYGPIIQAKGGVLDIQRKWTDPTVNASAIQRGKTWTINMYGGLARHATVTGDGFAVVACHELGHHIGGFPKIGARWATNEGGSDYFSTLKCLRLIAPATAPSDSDPLAVEACSSIYKGDEGKRGACLRGTMAGVSVSNLLAELGRDPKPNLGKPDPRVVDKTDDAHPDSQCRLDTYFQGALCSKDLGEDVANSGPAAGSCTKAQGYTAGIRPRCWYKPPTAEAESDVVARLGLTSPKALQEKLDSMRAALSGRGI